MVVQILIGSVLGFLSGLGVGGGSLLLLWLTLIAGVDRSQARLINLMFFLPCALIATLFRRDRFRPNGSVALTAIPFALLGVWLGSQFGASLDTEFLKKAFGILFILCGIRELRHRVQK